MTEELWSTDRADELNARSARLRFCEPCRCIMKTRASVIKLKKFGIPLCSGAEARLHCSFRAIAESRLHMLHPDLDDVTNISVTFRAFRKWKRVAGDDDVDKLELAYRDPDTGRLEALESFRVFTSRGNQAARDVTSRAPIHDMASDAALDQIREWIDVCEASHAQCPKSKGVALPSRVLDVKPPGDSNTQVRVWESAGTVERYAALSYCWGGPQPVVLTTATLSDMSNRISIRSLPQTLQDAILITRRLGLRYLWIDALCIIQDSPADKNRELKAMSSTYRHAAIVISAAAATTVAQGFLQPRTAMPSHYPPIILPYRPREDDINSKNTRGKTQPQLHVPPESSVTLTHPAPTQSQIEAINTRAWTLQERLLAPRVLIFGTHELGWECQSIVTAMGGTRNPGSRRLHPAFFPTDSSGGLGLAKFRSSWTETIADYTHRHLTFPGDKLEAISALAAEFSRLGAAYAGQGNKYLAGLWEDSLLVGLMWRVNASKKGKSLEPRPSVYVAPSWSWASVNGLVKMSSGSGKGKLGDEENQYAEALECEVTLKNDMLPMGSVVGGVLRLRGLARKSRLQNNMLLDETGDSSMAWAMAILDAEEDRPDVVTCFRMESFSGLILAPIAGSPITFQRLGVFEVQVGDSVARSAACDAWFGSCTPEVSTIV